jgi:hypothetical protein
MMGWRWLARCQTAKPMAAGFDHYNDILKVRGRMLREDRKKFGVHCIERTAPEAEQNDPDVTEGLCSVEKATKIKVPSHEDQSMRGRVL